MLAVWSSWHGVLQAAVALLLEVGSYEDALALALATDMALATSVASRPERDRLRQRQLWLAIARHVIRQPATQVGHCAPIHIAFIHAQRSTF